jgi:16S rRNA (guanine527-N7)-methyltransferase
MRFMETVRRLIREGLLHFEIEFDVEKPVQLSWYVEELERWNRRMNLVGLERAEEVIRELIWDAFFLYASLRGRRSILDLGSGAGIVAIPLAILDAGMHLISVDKSLKKIQFQRHVKRLLDLTNLEIVHARIEEVQPLGVDAVIAKAFGTIAAILEGGRRHLTEGGSAFMVKGKKERAAVHEGFVLEDVRRYTLPKSDKDHQLFVYKKVS